MYARRGLLETRREFLRESSGTALAPFALQAAQVLGFFGLASAAGVFWTGDAYAKSCGAPRKAAPQRRKGGESVPPLPLPATLLRRTEKKRPPSPPALVGKLEYGNICWGTDDNGRKYS